ncbi:IS3 family transposase [Streptomyces sp. ISL-98]|nr:IS3 family transposase [Streptomyces sp. ISL-98]
MKCCGRRRLFSPRSSPRPGSGDGAPRRAPVSGGEPVLRELHIASSTYYRWRQQEQEPCERRRRDAELTAQIQRIADSGGIYGSPRVHAVLRREGVHVGRKRVERLMREADPGVSARRKGFTRRDPKATLAPDLVNRDFTAPGPIRAARRRRCVHRRADRPAAAGGSRAHALRASRGPDTLPPMPEYRPARV